MAELKAEAARIEHETELDCQTHAREAEIKFIREQNELEISKAKELSTIEVRSGQGSSENSLEVEKKCLIVLL